MSLRLKCISFDFCDQSGMLTQVSGSESWLNDQENSNMNKSHGRERGRTIIVLLLVFVLLLAGVAYLSVRMFGEASIATREFELRFDSKQSIPENTPVQLNGNNVGEVIGTTARTDFQEVRIRLSNDWDRPALKPDRYDVYLETGDAPMIRLVEKPGGRAVLPGEDQIGEIAEQSEEMLQKAQRNLIRVSSDANQKLSEWASSAKRKLSEAKESEELKNLETRLESFRLKLKEEGAKAGQTTSAYLKELGDEGAKLSEELKEVGSDDLVDGLDSILADIKKSVESNSESVREDESRPEDAVPGQIVESD